VFWWGVLTGFVICLVLVAFGILALIYIFPEDLSRSQLGFIRRKQQDIRDRKIREFIQRKWPQLNASRASWLFQVSRLSGGEFEDLMASVYRKRGYEVEKVGGPGDHGADLIARKLNEVICIQCKRWGPSFNVGNQPVKDMVAAMRAYGATRGILVTTTSLTKAAEGLASRMAELEVVAGPQVIALMEEVGFSPEGEIKNLLLKRRQ
jgi:restriction endonuclease Mrr